MLVSAVIKLHPTKEGSLPPTTGGATHGAFFRWLSLVNPALANQVHDSAGAKAFTVSQVYAGDGKNPLEISKRPSNVATFFKSDTPLWFRITSLDEQLSECLLNNLYARPLSNVELLQHTFEVARVAVYPHEHPWAAVGQWKDLLDVLDPKQIRPNQKARLLFLSPTTFKSNDISLPFPLPEQLFTSLAKRWNAFSPVQLELDFFEFIRQNIMISGYQLETETVSLQSNRQGPKLVCFRGWCEYTTANRAEASIYNLALDLLTRFAFFAGVGYKTTMGFGQTIALGEGVSSR